MNWNHMCLFIGALFIVLGVTVFAHAAANATLDCSNTFDCGIEAYCGSTGAEGLLLFNGECGHNGSEPCNYSFSSTTSGNHYCSITVNGTGYGNGVGYSLQDEEVSDVYINGTYIGTTEDDYANSDDPIGTTFCGTAPDILTGYVTLSSTNTITFDAQDSYAIESVVINCTPSSGGSNNGGSSGGAITPQDPCINDLAPIIDSIENKSISYGGSFNMDLWDFVDDQDYDTLSDLNISASVSGTSLTCTLTNQRYLSCATAGVLGTSTVTISATDPCGKSATESFDVTVSNIAPFISVPDQTNSCASNMTAFLDLSNYAGDEYLSNASFFVTGETNTTLMNCYVTNSRYLTCDVNVCSNNYSDITVMVVDEFGWYYEDTFRMTLKNYTPTWKTSITPVCINESKTRIVDLRDYATDTEDLNTNLKFSLTQSNANAVNCYIDSNYYVSCNNVSNQASSNTLTIRATDSNGLYADTTMNVSTNCFYDSNGVNTGITFSAPTKSVCMEKCAFNSTPLTLANNSKVKKCFNFLIDTTPTELSPTLSTNNVCLNAGESTTLYLNANTCGATYSSYSTRVYDKDNNVQLYFGYEIGTCSAFDGFNLDEVNTNICQGSKKEFSVVVTNTSTETKTITLSADNSTLLPYFDRTEVTLAAGEKKNVTLVANAKFASLGKQRIQLHGTATNYAIDKALDVEIVDCSNIVDRTFMITTPSYCYDVSRGQVLNGSFTVKCLNEGSNDCSLYPRNISLGLFGIPGELSYNSLSLKCTEEKKVDFSVKVPEDAAAGKYYFSIVGTEQKRGPFDEETRYSEDKSICLNVAGQSNAGIMLRTQTKDIPWCGTEIFELEITNTGDFDENFNLSATQMPVGVSVLFSESFVVVPKGTSKIVYVSISTNTDAQISDGQKVKIMINGRVPLESTIYFNVKGKAFFDNLEILSAITDVTMNANTSLNYSIIVRNNSDKTLNDVTVTFEGIPRDVNMETVVLAELLPGKTATIVGKISAGDVNGTFYPAYVVSSDGLMNKKEMTLKIVKEESAQGLFSGLFGGFFGLSAGGQDVVAAIVLAIFLILLIAVIILGVMQSSKPASEEAWTN